MSEARAAPNKLELLLLGEKATEQWRGGNNQNSAHFGGPNYRLEIRLQKDWAGLPHCDFKRSLRCNTESLMVRIYMMVFGIENNNLYIDHHAAIQDTVHECLINALLQSSGMIRMYSRCRFSDILNTAMAR